MHSMLRLLAVTVFMLSTACAVDYHKTHPEAWKATNINEAAMALYGKEKFSTIKQSLNMELIAPKELVENPQQIPIEIHSNIPAKSVAVMVDKHDKALVAVFHRNNFEKIDLGLNISLERKATLFVVIESMNGVLYYRRAFIDILCLPCMAK